MAALCVHYMTILIYKLTKPKLYLDPITKNQHSLLTLQAKSTYKENRKFNINMISILNLLPTTILPPPPRTGADFLQ